MNRNWKQNVCGLLLGTSLIAFANVGDAGPTGKKSPPKANSNKPLLKAKVSVSAKKTPAKFPVIKPPRPLAAPAVGLKKPAGSVAQTSSKRPVNGTAPKNLSSANGSTLRVAAAPKSKTAPGAVANAKTKGQGGKGNTSSQSPSSTKATEKGKGHGGSTAGTRLMSLVKRYDGLISGVRKGQIESPLATRDPRPGNGVAGILKPLIGVPTKPIQAVLTDLPQGFVGVSLDPSANVLPAKQGSLSSFNLTRDNPFLTAAMGSGNRLDNMAAGIAGGTQGTSRAEAQDAFLSGMNASDTAMMAETKAEYDWARGNRTSQASTEPSLRQQFKDWLTGEGKDMAKDAAVDVAVEVANEVGGPIPIGDLLMAPIDKENGEEYRGGLKAVLSPEQRQLDIIRAMNGKQTPNPDDAGGDGPPNEFIKTLVPKEPLRFVKGTNMIANPDPNKIRHQTPIMDAARPASPRTGQDSTPVTDDGMGNSGNSVRTGTVRALKWKERLIGNPGTSSDKPAPPRPSLPGSPGTEGPSGIVGTPTGSR